LTNLAKFDSVSRVATFSIGEAKTHLSKLVALAEKGEPVELRRGKQTVVKLVPVSKRRAARRKPGALAGRIKMTDDFDTWPEDVARSLGVVD
jgi:antitoxin (DNA-binding transcriptional repressor) of toxin-antitoxin stability system